MTRPLVFLLAAAGVIAALALWPGDGLTLAGLRGWLADAALWRAANPWRAAGAFWLAYVTVTALSLPFAVWMTLAAGALFGLPAGLALALSAATCGATLAFLAARHGLRGWVTRRFGAQLAAVNRGIDRDGALYLFSLRLVPVIPFFAVNLLMGLTSLPARRFALVSLAGMLPGTALYANAGTQIAGIGAVSDIATPGVALAFALLAALPWGARWALGAVRRRRLQARWTRPRRFDRNLVVIGAGSAGLVSAYLCTALRARVTLVEQGAMGGDCLNTGCVPSKALIRAARLAHEMAHADRLGLTPAAPAHAFPAVMARVRAVIATIAPHDSAERYRALGAEVLQGRARLLDPWTVEVTDAAGATSRRTTRAVILATGATPAVPEVPGLAGAGFVTSETLWAALAALDVAPRRLVILGGGPIGCELAQAMARLGSAVTLIEPAPTLLPREDGDVAQAVADALRADGVEVLAGHAALAVTREGEARIVTVQGPDGPARTVPCDMLLVATGRQPRLSGLGLEALGIDTARLLETNAYLETLHPNILAAGDVAGPFQLTHAGAHQAWFATVNALFGGVWRLRADYRVMPRAVFTDPEVARVGLSEGEARAAGTPFEVTRLDLAGLDRAVAEGAARGFIKVLTVPGRDRILGVTIVADRAGEMIAESVLAMRHGIGLKGLLATVHIYPTLAEANRQVAGQWRRAQASPRALALLARFHAWRRG